MNDVNRVQWLARLGAGPIPVSLARGRRTIDAATAYALSLEGLADVRPVGDMAVCFITAVGKEVLRASVTEPRRELLN